jgi:hypothetical protein
MESLPSPLAVDEVESVEVVESVEAVDDVLPAGVPFGLFDPPPDDPPPPEGLPPPDDPPPDDLPERRFPRFCSPVENRFPKSPRESVVVGVFSLGDERVLVFSVAVVFGRI